MRCWTAASSMVAMLVCVQLSAAQDDAAVKSGPAPQPAAAAQPSTPSQPAAAAQPAPGPPQPSAAGEMAARAKSNALQPIAAKSSGARPAATPVLVVMEAAGGVRAGAALRSALNARPEVRVVSQSDLVRKSQSPAAVITVAAISSQIVSVAYWDMTGARDWLSSPAPAQADRLDAVVLALASALLDRHRGDLVESSRRTVGASDFSRNASALYAMLDRFAKTGPRTNVSLRYEDF